MILGAYSWHCVELYILCLGMILLSAVFKTRTLISVLFLWPRNFSFIKLWFCFTTVITIFELVYSILSSLLSFLFILGHSAQAYSSLWPQILLLACFRLLYVVSGIESNRMCARETLYLLCSYHLYFLYFITPLSFSRDMMLTSSFFST